MSASADMLVSTEWLGANLRNPEVLIFDCTTRIVPDPATIYRTEAARAAFEAGHIPGAQFIDIQHDLSDNHHRCKFMLPDARVFGVSMERFGVFPEAHVVLYSAGDPWWATRVWWLLRVFGFDLASVLDGGAQKWTKEGRPTEVGAGRAHPRGRFIPRQRPELLADRAEVLAAIGNPAVCIVSARQPSQFAGKDGNSYGRPGRIAGSVNLPAASMIDPAANTFLPLARLREAFAALDIEGRRVIAYCGHGVAASATVFALAMLGYPDWALYDGSLNEWAATDDLPMAVG